jgi:O-antigen ligase
MKFKDFLISGELTFYSCIACIVILPLYIHWLPPFMILWGLFWIIENSPLFNKRTLANNKHKILFLSFLILYMWQITGLLYADSLNMGIERISKRLSLLLFPLVLFYPGNKIVKNINLILRLFAVCTFVYIIYCFGNALHNSMLVQDGTWIFNPHPVEYDYENYFFGSRLSDTVHPSYLAMYVLLSMIISVESFFDKSISVIKRYFWILVTIIFLTVIYLLSSRSGVLSLVITLPLYLLLKFYRKFPKWIVLVALTILVISFTALVRTNDRINDSIVGISKTNINDTFNNDVRFLIWKSAIGVIKQNFILGVGTGDASEELKKEYSSRGYIQGYYENLNAHNQYLEILLENGIIGLMLFMGILGYMSFIALSDRNLIYGCYILIMLVFFFFETVLNRLAGITFFPLFSFLILHLDNSKSK